MLGQGRLGGSCVAELEGEHEGPLPDPEGSEAVADVVWSEPPGECRRQDLAGEPPLRLQGNAVAHQLEGDDDRRLLDAEALEVAELAGAPDDDEPGLGGTGPRRN